MHRRSRWVVVAVVALVAAGCGTRLPDRAFVSAGQSEQTAGDSGGEVATGEETPVDGATDPGTGGDAGAAGGTDAGAGGTPSGGEAGGGGAAPSGGGGGGTTGGGGAAARGSGAAPAAGGPKPAAGGNGASDVGVTATAINVGNITAVNGPLGDAFSRTLRGAQAYFARLNEQGGVNGRKINFLTCDDKEDKTKSAACAKDLVDGKKVFAFVANDSRAYGGAASFINEKGVPDVAGFPITNAYYRFPHSYTIYGTGYPRDGKSVGVNGKLYETTVAFKYFKQQVKVDKAAVFYYDIDESRQYGQGGIAQGLKLEGIEIAYYGGGSERGVNLAAPSFDTDVINMQRAGVQGIWDAMDDAANRRLCAAMDRYNFRVKAKVSTIVAWGQSVGTKFSSPCRDSVYVGGTSVPYSVTSNPGVAEFRAAMQKYQPNAELHQWALEGYFAAKWFIDGVKTMGANVTRKGLEDWLKSLKGYTAGGVFIARDYQPENYNAPSRNECISVAQWQDAQKTFVSRVNVPTTCFDAKQYSFQPLESGT